ncbi:GPI ethanolamine phosphate transferase 1-like [Branchiostoma floridae]|uniref:GPI ethanolamine phosphate transferase 1 n=1 Tax=Branchiostoma floridae TaxID=7739 RepID=A0A9J7LET4_BRAFL|nr:GPI ethanolamine phosphate transferase 1-like [Branchiostoma floridae]
MLLFFLGALSVHVIYFASIFDIYFTSPLVHGMTPHSTPAPPPAKRLVLFVGDGLRADRFFELDKHGQTRAPYLRDIIQTRGTWGVSHTRVPTESRPGHVALIAGFYEDVSAVAKGWKENPVEFDSVFNQSQETWAWGSPDILPMFAKGATGDHVHTYMYSSEEEDFADSDPGKLDNWVFERVEAFLQEAHNNETLGGSLQQSRVVLFLHLLGIDTSGHAYRPMSNEYLENIRMVDAGIQKTVGLLEEFFQHDGQTAYVFTSDHGMTDWGSHGAGHPSETLTPLLAWGAGVAGPQSGNTQDYMDGFGQEWKLENIRRCDVNQADIAPLMSSLIGVPFPLNSVGTLPLDYLDNTDGFKAESLFTNARQVVDQFEVKMKQKRETTLSMFFIPYSDLTPSKQQNMLRNIISLMQTQQYQKAILECRELIDLALKGLHYYHTYDRLFLCTSVTLGFIGWMSYVVLVLLRDHTTIIQQQKLYKVENSVGIWTRVQDHVSELVCGTLAAAILLFLLVIKAPWTYYVYCLPPAWILYCVLQRGSDIYRLAEYIKTNNLALSLLGSCVLAVLSLELLVLSFFWRQLLTLGLVAMALWPWLAPNIHCGQMALVGWTVSSLLLAVFPTLPVVGREPNYSLVIWAGILGAVAAFWCASRKETKLLSSNSKSSLVLIITQILLMVMSIYVRHSTAASLLNKEGNPVFNQVFSWTMLGCTFLLPLLSLRLLYPRLLSISLALMTLYLLLSTAHEALFCLTLGFTMFFWLQMEHGLSNYSHRKLEDISFTVVLPDSNRKQMTTDNIRHAYFFVFFIITAFFGTGNIASINSFDPQSIYCFLTVFNPFVMGSLLLLKIMVPFLMVTCAFRAVDVVVQVPTRSLFLTVLLMSDLMGLHFFFLVQDTGS